MATSSGDFVSHEEESNDAVATSPENDPSTEDNPSSNGDKHQNPGSEDTQAEFQDSKSEPDDRQQLKETDASDLTHCHSLDSVKELEIKFRCLKFKEYDFAKDDQFQVGWKKLSAVVPADQLDQQLLKAKLFYYSKNIQPLDVNDYLNWKEKNPTGKAATRESSDACDKGDNSCSTDVQSGTDSKDVEVALSFSDVMELIQSGKSIPGLKTLDIKPTDTYPSPSVLERKNKPWES